MRGHAAKPVGSKPHGWRSRNGTPTRRLWALGSGLFSPIQREPYGLTDCLWWESQARRASLTGPAMRQVGGAHAFLSALVLFLHRRCVWCATAPMLWCWRVSAQAGLPRGGRLLPCRIACRGPCSGGGGSGGVLGQGGGSRCAPRCSLVVCSRCLSPVVAISPWFGEIERKKWYLSCY